MFYNGYQSASAAMEKISASSRSGRRCRTPRSRCACRGDGCDGLRRRRVRLQRRQGRAPEFDLHIPAGQTIALVGSTGAGKSTLSEAHGAVLRPVAGLGAARRGGPAGDRPEGHAARDRHGDAGAYLFSGSVADNIALGKPGATRDEIVRAAEAVGAHTFIEALPDGYDTDVNKRGGRVSAGQRQLLSFAPGVHRRPKGAHPRRGHGVARHPVGAARAGGARDLLADRTAVIIAHRLSTVAIAHRVLVMEYGRIVEDGTPDDLIAGTGRFRAAARGLARLARLTDRAAAASGTGPPMCRDDAPAPSARHPRAGTWTPAAAVLTAAAITSSAPMRSRSPASTGLHTALTRARTSRPAAMTIGVQAARTTARLSDAASTAEVAAPRGRRDERPEGDSSGEQPPRRRPPPWIPGRRGDDARPDSEQEDGFNVRRIESTLTVDVSPAPVRRALAMSPSVKHCDSAAGQRHGCEDRAQRRGRCPQRPRCRTESEHPDEARADRVRSGESRCDAAPESVHDR